MARLKLLALIVSVGVISRMVIPLNDIFNSGFINFIGPDSYYHASVLKDILANFPAMPNMYIQDWAIVCLAWVVTLGEPTMRAVEITAIFIPPLMAGAVILMVYFITSRLFGRVSGLVAATFVAFLPGEFLERTLLGHIDHHAMEVLVTTGIMAIVVYVITQKRMRAMFLGLVCLGAMALVYNSTWIGLGVLISDGMFAQNVLTLITTTEAASLMSLNPHQILHILLGITCLAVLVKSGNGWQRYTIAVWLIVAIGLTAYQVRFGYYLVVPLAIAVGYAVYQARLKFTMLNFINDLVLGVVVLLSVFMFIGSIRSDHHTPTAEWNRAAAWIKSNTSENVTLLAWWDYGHFLQYRAERATFVDPGQSSINIPIAARVMLSPSDNLIVPADYMIVDSKTAHEYYVSMALWAGQDYDSFDKDKTLVKRLYDGQAPDNFLLVYDSTVKIWRVSK